MCVYKLLTSLLSPLGGVLNDVMCRTDLVSVSLLVFGIIGGNELHSGRKGRSVLFVMKDALNKSLSQITFYIRKMLHTKTVQMKMSIVVHSDFNTLSKNSV